MTQRNHEPGGGNGHGRESRDGHRQSAESYERESGRGSHRGVERGELGAHGIWESHAGYGDYGTRDYDPHPDWPHPDWPHPDGSRSRRRGSSSRRSGSWGGGEPPHATRPRDFRDYGRGDYRGNVGPGGFGYAESNYGPTRYGEAYGRDGRESQDDAQDRDRRERERSFAGRGPRNYQRSDERIRETICERLTEDPYVDASDVTVDVKDGVVTLAGTVPERRMKHRIEDIASDVAREKEVRNDVRVTS